MLMLVLVLQAAGRVPSWMGVPCTASVWPLSPRRMVL